MCSEQSLIKMSVTFIVLLFLCIMINVVKLNNTSRQKNGPPSQDMANVTRLSNEKVTVTGIPIQNDIETATVAVTTVSSGILNQASTQNIIFSERVTSIISGNGIWPSTENVASVLSVTQEPTTDSVILTQNSISSAETTTFSHKTKPYISNENGKETLTEKLNQFSDTNLTENATAMQTTNSQELTVECETPNYEQGLCVDIKMCGVLLNQINNTKIWPFIRASTCGLSKDGMNPKVCCGKFHNFRNVSKNIVNGDISAVFCGYQKMAFTFRIMHGKEAYLGEYPWMALLIQLNKNGEKIIGCAAFLISNQYVVTAAHCTHSKYTMKKGPIVSVLLGEHNIQTSTDCQGSNCVTSTRNLRIEKVITHSGFDPEDKSYHNDIALIKLKKKVQYTDYIRPICLITAEYRLFTKYHLSGWGNTENGTRSDVKLKVELPLFDRAECARKYSRYNISIQNSQICAGGEHQDACNGDSGGPLMVSSDKGIWYASGIVSFGLGCGQMGWPGVYTNITSFLPWIKSQMAQT